MTNTDNASGAGMETLRQALEKATPGPWLYRAKSNTFYKPPPEGTKYRYGESIIALSSDEDETPQQIADMDFLLAAVNPEAIRALFDASRLLAEKEGELQRMREVLRTLGVFTSHRGRLESARVEWLDDTIKAALKP